MEDISVQIGAFEVALKWIKCFCTDREMYIMEKKWLSDPHFFVHSGGSQMARQRVLQELLRNTNLILMLYSCFSGESTPAPLAPNGQSWGARQCPFWAGPWVPWVRTIMAPGHLPNVAIWAGLVWAAGGCPWAGPRVPSGKAQWVFSHEKHWKYNFIVWKEFDSLRTLLCGQLSCVVKLYKGTGGWIKPKEYIQAPYPHQVTTIVTAESIINRILLLWHS